MIDFQGKYFDGKMSKPHNARIEVTRDIITLYLEEGAALNFPLKECIITPPLGKTRRSIKLPLGALCETDDFQAIYRLEKKLGTNRALRLVNFLESHWKWVAGCFAGLAFCIWLFLTIGIPYLAEKAAYAIPVEINKMISEKTLAVLDNRFLEASELKPERREALRQMFDQLIPPGKNSFNYRLEFRKSGPIGPNAFALPSGLIVMTDELVELSEDDRQLAGILKHETTHVQKRHGLRSVFQNAGVFLLISILVGDISSITSTAATLPTLLAESTYSRAFEREADRVAGLYCIEQGWTTSPLRNILERIDKQHSSIPGTSLLSTHPLTTKRLQALEELEKSM